MTLQKGHIAPAGRRFYSNYQNDYLLDSRFTWPERPPWTPLDSRFIWPERPPWTPLDSRFTWPERPPWNLLDGGFTWPERPPWNMLDGGFTWPERPKEPSSKPPWTPLKTVGSPGRKDHPRTQFIWQKDHLVRRIRRKREFTWPERPPSTSGR